MLALLADALDYLGLELNHTPSPKYSEAKLGIKTNAVGQNFVVTAVFSGGTADMGGIMLEDEILAGRSITIVNKEEKFYSSAIVGGTISIAMGVAMANKRNGSTDKVWCFVGDMAFETGAFMENYKYAKNFDLPITFIVEDNKKLKDVLIEMTKKNNPQS